MIPYLAQMLNGVSTRLVYSKIEKFNKKSDDINIIRKVSLIGRILRYLNIKYQDWKFY